jgi:hypothetical protein
MTMESRLRGGLFDRPPRGLCFPRPLSRPDIEVVRTTKPVRFAPSGQTETPHWWRPSWGIHQKATKRQIVIFLTTDRYFIVIWLGSQAQTFRAILLPIGDGGDGR